MSDACFSQSPLPDCIEILDYRPPFAVDEDQIKCERLCFSDNSACSTSGTIGMMRFDASVFGRPLWPRTSPLVMEISLRRKCTVLVGAKCGGMPLGLVLGFSAAARLSLEFAPGSICGSDRRIGARCKRQRYQMIWANVQERCIFLCPNFRSLTKPIMIVKQPNSAPDYFDRSGTQPASVSPFQLISPAPRTPRTNHRCIPSCYSRTGQEFIGKAK